MICFYKNDKATVIINEEITNENANEICEFLYGVEFLDEVKDIEVVINSGGGSVTGGYSIFRALLKSEKVVQTTIAGVCASICSIIFLAGQIRKVESYGLFMIHNPSGGDSAVLNLIKDSLKQILSTEQFGNLDELMDEETWYSPDDLVESSVIKKEDIIKLNKQSIMTKEVKANVEQLQLIANNILSASIKDAVEIEIETPEEEVKEVTEEEIMDQEEVAPEMSLEELKKKIAELILENESLKADKGADVSIEDMEQKCKDLEKENEEMKASINLVKVEEEIKQKEEILNLAGIKDKKDWIGLDLNKIKELTKTINKKSPEIIFNNVAQIVDLKKLTAEEKVELMESDPKAYAKMFIASKK